MQRNEFPMTVEGCQRATEYLKRIGRYEEFQRNRTSTDGFSLVYFANSLKDKENALRWKKEKIEAKTETTVIG